MRLLLDTHVFLWWMDGAERLQPNARQAIEAPSSEVFLSAVSAWEIEIKRSRHVLSAPIDVASAMAEAGFRQLPVTVEHAEAIRLLPPHHGDPFDRMLVAQATVEGLKMVTRDRAFADYDVPLLQA